MNLFKKKDPKPNPFFEAFGRKETVLMEFTARIINGTSGFLEIRGFLTRGVLCFIDSSGSIKVTLALTSFTNMIQCLEYPGNPVPYLQPLLPGPGVVATGFQISTRDGLVIE